jgi:hypothetical protein
LIRWMVRHFGYIKLKENDMVQFIIGFVMGALVVAIAGAFIYRNNFTKFGKIMKVLESDEFNLDKIKAIEAIVKDDCKDCK